MTQGALNLRNALLLIVLTYANRERVDGPAAILTLCVPFAQAAVPFVAIKPHHSAFEQRRHEAINKPRARACSGRASTTLTCCRASAVRSHDIRTIFIPVARILETFQCV